MARRSWMAAVFGALALAACGMVDRAISVIDGPLPPPPPPAVAPPPPPPTMAPPAAPPLSPPALLHHISRLASDEFEGRKPATPAERLTLNYVAGQMAGAGLEPAGPGGSWFQEVPLVSATVAGISPLVISGPAVGPAPAPPPQELQHRIDFVAWTKRPDAEVGLDNAELVFVGYGVVAPELGWNDYAGQDMRGKVAVILINDPDFGVEAGHPTHGRFGGRAMTYYGRWTYKFEEAARQGAAGALIVHETAAAAYPWAVVQSSWTGAQLDIRRPDGGRGRAAVEGWLSLSAAQGLFQRAGLSYEALRAAAQQPGFVPRPMGITAALSLRNEVSQSRSYNVIGRVRGAARPDEAVLYTAHWDHLGRCPPVDGDDICNGALDNATGTAGLIELARRFASEGRSLRSAYFIAFTAEEQGLLGSAHYAESPTVPAARTVAAINMDGLSIYGPARDITVVGYGKSDMDQRLAAAAAAQGRRVSPESFPERGSFYRSDHFSLAKIGVPVLYTNPGVDLLTGGAARGRELVNTYVTQRYHKPDDELGADWDLTGASQDLQLLYSVGRGLAASADWPRWAPDAEFRAVREASLQGR